MAGTLKVNSQTFESNILISRQGLDNKLNNFGKIIVEFHKYYNIELKKRVLGSNDADNFKNTSVFHVGDSLFTEFNNDINSANAIFKKILTNFKRSRVAKDLLDLELFNMHNLVKDKQLWIKGANDSEPTQDKIVFNYKNGSFCLAFTFGQDWMNSIFYTSYGSNVGDINVQHGWWAWILIDK